MPFYPHLIQAYATEYINVRFVVRSVFYYIFDNREFVMPLSILKNRRTSIRTKMILSTMLILILTTMVITTISVLSLISQGNLETEQLRQEIYAEKKHHLKNVVDVAYSALLDYYTRISNLDELKNTAREQLEPAVNLAYSVLEYNFHQTKIGTLSRTAAMQKALALIKTMRYRKNDYFWVHNLEPRMIMHPHSTPDLYPEWYEPNGLKTYTDPDGKHVFQDMVDLCKEYGEGFVAYSWEKPDSTSSNPTPKLSFVKLFKPWNWIIGSGVWLEVEENQAKQEAIRLLASLQYDEGNYFWINDTEPKMIMHPNYPPNSYPEWYKPNGLTDYTDKHGTRIFSTFVQLCKQDGSGFLPYYWTKPGAKSNEPAPKLSYVQLFEPWNWIVGSGIYIDDVDTLINQKTTQLTNQIWQIVIQTFIIALIALSGGIVLLIWISNRISRSIRNLVHFAQQVADGYFYRKVHIETSDEIALLAQAVNSMAQTLNRFESEIDKLIQAVVEGHLLQKGQDHTFKGGYHAIIQGINFLMSRMVYHFDTLPVGILILSREGEIRYGNHLAGTIFGLEQDILIGSNCLQLMQPLGTTFQKKILSPVIEEERHLRQEIHISMKGITEPFLCTAFPLKEATNHVVGAFLIWQHRSQQENTPSPTP
jgi:PAS domain S-box-containing protein